MTAHRERLEDRRSRWLYRFQSGDHHFTGGIGRFSDGRGIVAALQAAGLAAVRVPLSGAAGGRFSGDVIMPLAGRDLCLEVKARADGFRKLHDWLEGRDVLMVKAGRQEPLVVVRLSMAAEIAAGITCEPPNEIHQAAEEGL